MTANYETLWRNTSSCCQRFSHAVIVLRKCQVLAVRPKYGPSKECGSVAHEARVGLPRSMTARLGTPRMRYIAVCVQADERPRRSFKSIQLLLELIGLKLLAVDCLRHSTSSAWICFGRRVTPRRTSLRHEQRGKPEGGVADSTDPSLRELWRSSVAGLDSGRRER
jgi:hypothetical protein